MTVVLDSWAVLRYLEDAEPAAGEVSALLEEERPVISWLNVGEIYYVVCRTAGVDAADETVRDLAEVTTFDPVTDGRVVQAARLKAAHPMAFADAFAAAAAIAHDSELWTGDPELLVSGAPWRWRDLRS